MKNKKFKNIKRIFAVIIVTVMLLTFTAISSHAGDYGSWDSDFGDYSSGSDYSGGSSLDDDDYDSSGSGTVIFFGDGSSGGGDILGGLFIVIVIIVFVVIFMWIKKKGGLGGTTSTPIINMGDSSSVDEASLNALRQKDPAFSEAAILSWCENLYTTMQLAWSDFEYEQVRPFLGNALFAEHEKQLEAKAARNEKNCRSEIAVMQKKLERYRDDGHNEYLDVWLRIKMRDSLVKKSDPSVVIHPAKTFYMDFRWQLVRTSGAKTVAETDGVKTGTCPNCGAPINMNQSGKCEYCDSVISTAEHNWVLNKIDALQQRSV